MAISVLLLIKKTYDIRSNILELTGLWALVSFVQSWWNRVCIIRILRVAVDMQVKQDYRMDQIEKWLHLYM